MATSHERGCRMGSWMSTECSLNVPCKLTECSRNVPWMSTKCSLNIPWMFPECRLNVPWMLADCSLNVPWLSTDCSLNVPWMSTECSLNVPWMFPASWLNVPWMFPERRLNVPWMFPECSLNVPWTLLVLGSNSANKGGAIPHIPPPPPNIFPRGVVAKSSPTLYQSPRTGYSTFFFFLYLAVVDPIPSYAWDPPPTAGCRGSTCSITFEG
jgi:hypothetical protein